MATAVSETLFAPKFTPIKDIFEVLFVRVNIIYSDFYLYVTII